MTATGLELGTAAVNEALFSSYFAIANYYCSLLRDLLFCLDALLAMVEEETELST